MDTASPRAWAAHCCMEAGRGHLAGHTTGRKGHLLLTLCLPGTWGRGRSAQLGSISWREAKSSVIGKSGPGPRAESRVLGWLSQQHSQGPRLAGARGQQCPQPPMSITSKRPKGHILTPLSKAP